MSPLSIPKVLVGISTCNRADILQKAINSALAQDYPNLEVAVLDDGSSDATAELRYNYPEIRWLRHDYPLGYMASRNELMRTEGVTYYVSLDDDAWFLQGDEISLAVSLMQANPSLAVVAFDILSPDRPDIVARGPAEPVSLFIGCGHLLRLNAVAAAGYYTHVPGAYGTEEKDLSLRLADRGGELMLLPGVHVWHQKAWTGRNWYPLHRSGVCNELFMTLRRCPAPDILAVLPMKVASFAWYWLRQPQFLGAGLAGLWQFCRHLPDALAAREPVRRETFWRLARGNRSLRQP